MLHRDFRQNLRFQDNFPTTLFHKVFPDNFIMKPEEAPYTRYKKPPSLRLGAVSLHRLEDVHHPQDFMFRSLSHEEERQGVAREVEEPLPLPGGAGLRVRGEGCCREVGRED